MKGIYLWLLLSLTVSQMIAGISIVDPVSRSYVSGVYEVVLAADQIANIAQTQIFMDDVMVAEVQGWLEKHQIDFGEDIERHELRAVVVLKDGSKQQSPLVITKALKVDYTENTQLLLLSAVVKTKRNKPIVGLEKDRFMVMENGESLEIRNFYTETLPLDLVVLLDTSSSLRDGGLDYLKQAATTFVQGLAPQDRVALYEFKRKPHLLSGFTTDRKALVRSIAGLEPLGETALFNAMVEGLKDLKGRRRGRKALILFTDGKDSYYDNAQDKAKMMRQCIEMAQAHEVTIFTIGLGKKINKGALSRMAEETGGSFYHALKNDTLMNRFGDIIQDLKNQYMLGVVPKKGKGFHKVDITVKRRGAVVYARKGYHQ